MAVLLETRSPTRSALRSERTRRIARATLVTVALAGIAFGFFVLTMMVGSFRLSALEVIRAILGISSDPSVDFVVFELRLPQAGAALAAGLALGASGTVFQQLLRNPLASPDFVGVSSGASLAAVCGLLLWDLSGMGMSAAALAGAIVSSVAMYLLAWRDGVSGYRFILIGIGMSAFMSGLIGYLLTRASLFDARAAMHWLVGSVGQSGDRELVVLSVALLFLLPLAILLQRQLRVLELGDDAARALGTRAELARFGLIGVSVVLIAMATAVVGPILFVALVAGPVANRLLGPATGGILAAAFLGAILLLVADLIAVHVMPTELPTGVVTGAVGAPYLMWLLATTNREGVGG